MTVRRFLRSCFRKNYRFSFLYYGLIPYILCIMERNRSDNCGFSGVSLEFVFLSAPGEFSIMDECTCQCTRHMRRKFMEVEVFQKKLAEIVTCARYNNRKLDGEFVEKFFAKKEWKLHRWRRFMSI